MKQLLSLLLLFTGFKLFAQQTVRQIPIKGMLVDSVSKAPLDFATLFLTDAETAKAFKTTLTKNDGSFEIEAPVNRKYDLSFVFIGYRSKTIRISFSADERSAVVDLGKIALSPANDQLKEVSVTGFRPLLTKEIDRISFDVQADPESKSSDVLEMLRKVPMITVDGNNQIQLKGSSNYQVFINGKPSALMANNPSDVLSELPAASIQKIEVITVPPSKYDAEGLTGIINIITVKKDNDGFNGSVFTRYNSIYGERGSLMLNIKEGKIGFNTFFGLGHQPSVITQAGSQLSTFSPVINSLQQGENVNGGAFNNGHTQLSYEPDSLNLLTVLIDFNNRNFIQNTFRQSQSFAMADSLTQSYQLNDIGQREFGAFNLGANYQVKFKQDKDELLTLSYQYASANNYQTNNIATIEGFNYSNNNYDQQNSTGFKEQTFQVDFLKPVKKLIIEAGAKTILRNNNSYFEEENLDRLTGGYIPDTALTNKFNYHQDVFSIYNSYQFTFPEWTVKGGLRAENTSITGDYSDENSFTGHHYFNLIPAISIQRSLAGTGSLTLGFSERI
jgi:hypothetical protein